MMRFIRHIEKKKELLAALVLVFSFMSLALPRETFDPHIGIHYDIFCQLTSYINVDPRDLGWMVVIQVPDYHDTYPEPATVVLSGIVSDFTSIRAPPEKVLFPLAA